ncbi:glycosyltransferase family 4 protein [Microbacterium capsulatum]|uniref:D-inositol 3-phosphate glycosyltransferase n=1 Tax=Microbacterium capsulatum TaxID=3041921 RepID=A0ABU0XEE4_9MICO|nr:glycosyltransferase family 4 protein [Microbacterium sp. ASV81]MDQ4213488.1 glycosyltransferase family 4 protein [Microbacterium sp. ASV81]
MHVVFFGDQHAESLGGAQVSMRLQRKYLERAGHTVTIVAPRMHSHRHASAADPGYLDLPSIPITADREYAMTWPSRRTDLFLDRALAGRPPVDVVHVQADFWGAFIGHRFAHRHGIPAVHTMHNRVDVGIAAVTPLHRPVLGALNAWRRTALRGIGEQPRGNDGWAYLAGIAAESRAVTAPSGHFARRLEQHGVFGSVDVVWNGIDDEVREKVLAAAPLRQAHGAERSPGRPRFVWLGRMSPEKRLLPFLEAVVASDIDADVEIVGGGAQRRAAERIAARAGRPRIHFAGRIGYADVLARIAAADAVVQTSIGFETQGMTPFEAATLGTPTVVSDPDIAAELRGGLWAVPDAAADEKARVAALAETLRIAAADIGAGRAPEPDPQVAADFRQSSRTAAMLGIYERALGR